MPLSRRQELLAVAAELMTVEAALMNALAVMPHHLTAVTVADIVKGSPKMLLVLLLLLIAAKVALIQVRHRIRIGRKVHADNVLGGTISVVGVHLVALSQVLVVEKEPRVHVFGFAGQNVAAFVGIHVFSRDIGGRNETPAERLNHIEQEAEQVDAPGVVRVEPLGVPRVPLQLPLDALPVVPRAESHPVLLDRLVHPGGQLQLLLLADVGAADDQPDAVGLAKANAHVGETLRRALPQQERRLVVHVVSGEVDGAGDFPAVRPQRPDETGDEVAGLDGVVAVGPPGAAAQLELGGAVILALLEELQVPELIHALFDDRNERIGQLEKAKTVVTREEEGAQVGLFQTLGRQVRAPLEEKRVRGAVEVDVHRESPFERGENSGDIENDESGLDGGLARRVGPGLFGRPRRAVEPDAQHHRHGSLVVRQSLFAFNSRTPSQMDCLEDGLDGHLGHVDQEQGVRGEGRHADEFVRVVMQRNQVLRLSKAEENRSRRLAVTSQIGGDDDVITVAKERPQQTAKYHFNQGHVFFADGFRVVLVLSAPAAPDRILPGHVAARVGRVVEVTLVQDDVVDVEAPREADLIVLEHDVAEGVDGDELLEPLVDAPDDFGPDVDQTDPVGLLEREGEVGHRFVNRESRVRQLVLRLEIFHGEKLIRLVRGGREELRDRQSIISSLFLVLLLLRV